MIRDIVVKKNGLLVWHRNSFGILTQRLLLCILVVSGIGIFGGCIEGQDKTTGSCLKKSLIPLILPLVCVLCKVVCIKS